MYSGSDNRYMAGSPVLQTGGSGSPTLAIITRTRRLVVHMAIMLAFPRELSEAGCKCFRRLIILHSLARDTVVIMLAYTLKPYHKPGDYFSS